MELKPKLDNMFNGINGYTNSYKLLQLANIKYKKGINKLTRIKTKNQKIIS